MHSSTGRPSLILALAYARTDDMLTRMPLQDEYQTALLHIAYVTLQIPEVREFIEEYYDQHVVAKIVEDAREQELERPDIHSGSSHTGGQVVNRDVGCLVACFTKRTLSGIDVHETLSRCSPEHLSTYIMTQLGWQPRKERRRPQIKV